SATVDLSQANSKIVNEGVLRAEKYVGVAADKLGGTGLYGEDMVGGGDLLRSARPNATAEIHSSNPQGTRFFANTPKGAFDALTAQKSLEGSSSYTTTLELLQGMDLPEDVTLATAYTLNLNGQTLTIPETRTYTNTASTTLEDTNTGGTLVINGGYCGALTVSGGTVTGTGWTDRAIPGVSYVAQTTSDYYFLSAEAVAPWVNKLLTETTVDLTLKASVALTDTIVVPSGVTFTLSGGNFALTASPGKTAIQVVGSLKLGTVVKGNGEGSKAIDCSGAVALPVAGGTYAETMDIWLGKGGWVDASAKAPEGSPEFLATLHLNDQAEYSTLKRKVLDIGTNAGIAAKFKMEHEQFSIVEDGVDAYIEKISAESATITAVADATVTTQVYAGQSIDVSKLFTFAPIYASGSATYTIGAGTGTGTLADGQLTVTKAGTLPITAKIDDATKFTEVAPATNTLTVNKGAQSAPAAPTVAANGRTDTSITLAPIVGQQYSKDGTTWQDEATFSGLTAATPYTFCARLKETDLYAASPASAGTAIATLSPTPQVGEGYTILYEAETITIASGYEASASMTDFTNSMKETHAVTPGATLYIRTVADTGIDASAPQTIAVPARPAAPTGITASDETEKRNDGKLSGITELMEWKGADWTVGSGKDVGGLAAGTYEVRVKATDSAFHSDAETFTLKIVSTPPAVGEGYTVLYAEEKLTVMDGYEAATADTFAAGTAIASGGAIAPGTSIYLRKAVIGTVPSGMVRGVLTVQLPARPAAPTVGTGNIVGTENTGAITGATGEMEYRAGTSGTFTAVGSGTTTIEGLAAGTYQVRLKAVADNSFAGEVTALTIGNCALTLTAPTFAAATYGDARPGAQGVVVASTGTATATVSGAELSGTNAGSFTLVKPTVDTPLSAGASDTASWTVQPNANLGAGTYAATLTLTHDGSGTATCNLSFTVNKATPTAASLAFAPPANLAAGDDGKSATLVKAPGVDGLGEITIAYYQGALALPAAPTVAGSYAVQASVAEGTNYLAATLTDGSWTYTITQDKEVTGLQIKQQPKLVYCAGEAPDLAALEVTIAYNDGTHADVARAAFDESITTVLWDGTSESALPEKMTIANHGKRIRVKKGTFFADTDALTVVEPVAKIEGGLFATLAEALRAAGEETLIELLADITESDLCVVDGQGVTLNMGGKTITLPTLTVKGTLKLQGGGTVEGEILNQSLNTVYVDGVEVTGGIKSAGGRVVVTSAPANGLTVVMTDPQDSVELGKGVSAGDVTINPDDTTPGAAAKTTSTGKNDTYYHSAGTALAGAPAGAKVALTEKATITSAVTIGGDITVDTSDAPATLIVAGGSITAKDAKVTYETTTENGLKAAAQAAGAGDTVAVTGGNVTLNENVEIKGDLKVDAGATLNAGGKLTVEGKVEGSVSGERTYVIVKQAMANGDITLHEADGPDLFSAGTISITAKNGQLVKRTVKAVPKAGYHLKAFVAGGGVTVTKEGAVNIAGGGTLGATFEANAGGGGPAPVAVTGVTMAQALSVKVGERATLVAAIAPENASDKAVTWTTSDALIATVDGGVVTGVAKGTTEITVTTRDGGFTATCAVTVAEAGPDEPDDPGKAEPGITRMAVRNGNALTLPVLKGYKGSWTSADEGVARIAKGGKRVTGAALGTT
ncbi:MAG: Ig-like domain-containing protein, partial [Clostridia bacterium]